ncbi:MAG: dihydrofolate reductase, partial [Sandaracinaceae bacterium]|nr:dihydrofolate reductase [Sandaracinaceae bacterium]
MRIALIAAVARNGVIGRGGALPWRLPDELGWFKERTLGKPVIMGRRTWESLRGALPGRLNVVVTRNENYVARGAL